ncbi:type II toxin-antitoxin system RelE/ParE family toxin [Candidatus Peregrinibacteria bacterium CG_4_10_14_0_2_um_filter_41_8]|nr:MAG: type II toxin-antitoxin system RelE/ParE family toxin [Candidatus Peregrinibacteria bacterium CG_4_10_14_0_2_um_filter_41_8]
MKKYLKFLARLPVPLRAKLLLTIADIVNGNLKNLDVIPLTGSENYYRCRVGKLRIIFEKTDTETRIHNIAFRGTTY